MHCGAVTALKEDKVKPTTRVNCYNDMLTLSCRSSKMETLKYVNNLLIL